MRVAEKLEAGEKVDLETLLAHYPEDADRLRRAVPAMRAMFDLGLDTVDDTSRGQTAAQPIHGILGDYRILREIGRGGMGVVYEAEQTSLGRRVALKVLPFASMLDERPRQRFQNEARAAATLEHPHIVPIHAVGQQRGVHYYAMKLIHGRSLATVLRELRRERPIPAGAGTSAPPATELSAEMLSGQGSSAVNGEGDPGRPAPDRAPEPERAPEPGLRSVDRARDGFSADSPAGLSSERSHRRSAYYRRVAEIGFQAADALHHAHSFGVTHRDIKPGNLLLDDSGNCWVTDFGLAHIESEGTLTRTGDVVGTFRYMSPEQARGESGLVDGRADIYGLGITLYELLTLRPAFPGTDRPQLIRAILEDDPPAPRRINPAIPRDLETIVLKAIEKDLPLRYHAASQLADDLRRFLDHEPVQARRPGLWDRIGKWCKRHQPLVISTAVLMLLLTSVLATAAIWINQERQRAVANMRLAQRAAARQSQLRSQAEQSEARAQKLLYLADMKLASQAWRRRNLLPYAQLLNRHRPTAGQPDLRDFAWHYLWGRGHVPDQSLARHEGEAWCVEVSPDGLSLASAGSDGLIRLYDSGGRLQRVLDISGDGQRRVHSVAFTPDSRRLVSADSDGQLRLWDLDSGSQQWAAAAHQPGQYHYLVAVSPSGDRIASTSTTNEIRLWDTASGEPRGTLSGHGDTIFGLAFSPQEPLLASASRDETVRLWDFQSRSELRVLSAHTNRLTSVAFSPDGQMLASGATDHSVRLWRVNTGKQLAVLKHLDEIGSVDFSQDGRWLAVGDRNRSIRLWRVEPDGSVREAEEFSPQWEAHQGRIKSLRFLPDGRLISAGKDGQVKLWAPFNNRSQRTVDTADDARTNDAAFADNGRLLLTAGEQELLVHDVATDSVIAKLSSELGDLPAVTVAPDGNIVAAADRHGWLEIWDLASRSRHVGCQIASQQSDLGQPSFSPDGSLLTVPDWTEDVLLIVDVASGQSLAELPAEQCHDAVFSADGSEVAVDTLDDIVIWDWAARRRLRTLRGHDSTVNDLALSPDRRLLATASNDRQVKIWDWDSGEPQSSFSGHEAPVEALAFSADGRLLISGGQEGSLHAWDVSSGLQVCELENFSPSQVKSLAFATHGEYLTCVLERGRVVVLEGARQRE